MPGPVKQLAVIPFTGGLDTKTDPRLVAPGKLLEAQNVVFKQTGALNRRWGYKQVTVAPGNTEPAAAVGLTTYNNALLLADGHSLWTYDATEQTWQIPTSALSVYGPNGLQPLVNCTQTNKSLVRNSGQQLSPDFATLNGVDYYVWEDQTNTTGTPAADGIWIAAFESSTGNFVYSASINTTSTCIRPKLVACPLLGVVFLFYVDTATSDLYAVKISQLSLGSSTLLLTGMGTNFYDVAVSPVAQADGSNGVILYSAHTTQYATWSSFTLSGGVPALVTTTTVHANPVTKSTTGTLSAIYEPGSAAFWLTYADNGTTSTSVSSVRYTSTSAATFNPVQSITAQSGQIMAVTTGALTAGGSLTILAEVHSDGYAPYSLIGGAMVAGFLAIGQDFIVEGSVSSAGSVGGIAAVIGYGFALASKMQFLNGQPIVNLAFQSPDQSCYFCAQILTGLTTPIVIAQTPSGLGGGSSTLTSSSISGGGAGNTDFMLAEFVQTSAGVFKYANLTKGSGQFTQYGNLLSLTGVQSTKLDFATANFQAVEIAGSLYTTGGVVQQYDGQAVVESNFLLAPEGVSAVNYSTSGGHISPGTYYYCVVWSWQDALGQVQYSTPSAPFLIVVAAGTSTNEVAIQCPVFGIGAKRNIQARIYRTAANGLTFTEVTTAQNAVYLNGSFVSAGAFQFIDGYADAAIAQNGAMYTQPLVTTSLPVLENTAPPPCTMMAPFDERLFVSGLDNPLAYAFSQQVVANIPLQFNAQVITGLVDPDGGAITGMARLDDKLVFFKATAIFYITGTGPDATGQSSSYSQPAFIPSGGVGCLNQASIVLVPKGLMFQSAAGWYLLDRGLNVSYVGAPVEFFNGLTVTSATLIPNQWVIWTTTSGTAIVYDYFYDQWSTFTNHPATDATLYNGLYYYATAGGSVMVQTPATFSDNGDPIPFSILTAKFALAQIQGYQRIFEAYLLGSYRGPGVTLTVGCAYDNDAKINAMAVVPVDNALGVTLVNSGFFGTELWTGTDGSTVLQLRFDICKKCESVQFHISDSQQNPGTEGFSLSAITLNVGVKRGGFKGLPAVQQFGVK